MPKIFFFKDEGVTPENSLNHLLVRWLDLNQNLHLIGGLKNLQEKHPQPTRKN
jgi:hypothetical protein